MVTLNTLTTIVTLLDMQLWRKERVNREDLKPLKITSQIMRERCMTNLRITAAQARKAGIGPRFGVTAKSGKKKTNPDPMPKVPAHEVKGESFNVMNDELLWCEVLITPPSVNHYWIRGANKTNRLSKRAIHFIDVMKRFIEPAGYQGRVRVKIEYAPPDAKIRDIDNIVKPCFDALSKGGLILDDSQVDELLVKRLPSEKGGKLIIQVEKLRV